MRTLGPSSAALAQFSYSLLLMALVTGPFLGRIASGGSRKTPYRILDLMNLKKLRRLNILIKGEFVLKDREVESMEEALELEHLKISWGVFETRYNNIHIILPSSLKNLHLECFLRHKI